jgi:hypothetical protein
VTKLIIYWLATALVAAAYFMGGYFDITQPPNFFQEIGSLGYPAYFFSILGVWKIGAALVLLAPALPRLKEWAYAGIVFNLTGATASHIFVKDPLGEILTPLIVLAIASVSYLLRPADRRLSGPWV